MELISIGISSSDARIFFHFFLNVFKAGPKAIDPITIIYNQVSNTLVAAVYSSIMKNTMQYSTTFESVTKPTLPTHQSFQYLRSKTAAMLTQNPSTCAKS